MTTRAAVSGSIFRDDDGNGTLDDGESPLGAWFAYVDLNKDGRHEDNEPEVQTDLNGNFTIPSLKAGKARIAVDLPNGWRGTVPASAFVDITLKSGQARGGIKFGVMAI